MSNLPHVRRPVAHEKKKRERRSSVVSFSNAIAGRGARRLRRRLRAQRRFLSALTAATLASTILSTTFDLFYVETFLEAYELPLSSYGVGMLFIALISMGNDIVGAYVVDSYAVRSARGSIIGTAGCVLAASFLAPFFRGKRIKESSTLAMAHFVASLSLYGALFNFFSILVTSMFTDASFLSEKTRINFMASGKCVNFVGSLLVGRIGLSRFDTGDLGNFRIFVLGLAALASVLFLLSQRVLGRSGGGDQNYVSYSVREQPGRNKTDGGKQGKKLSMIPIRQAMRDLKQHKNFWVWISMEALLEAQLTFASSFNKFFFDELIVGTGLSTTLADWLLASIGPTSQVLGIVLFMPIRNTGYHHIYTKLFQAKIALSLALVASGSASSTKLITIFLFVGQVATTAVKESGFQLAMSDMVAEMKLQQAKAGRLNEPSLAGLLIGANAVCCKPIGALIPVVAAWRLARVGFSTGTHKTFFKVYKEAEDENVRLVLYRLLFIPPLVLSIIQLLVWRRYKLGGERAEEVRLELRRLKKEEGGANKRSDNEDSV